MALLRYVARRVSVPALRRASGSPVPRAPLASCSYYHQAGYCNGEACRRQRTQEFVIKNKAKIDAAMDAIMRAKRMKKIERRIDIVAGSIGAWLAWCTIGTIDRELRSILGKRDTEPRQLREIMEEEDMNGEEMDEAADIEGDKRE